jgi:tetrahydrodipicolinate N-acetyltransferase
LPLKRGSSLLPEMNRDLTRERAISVMKRVSVFRSLYYSLRYRGFFLLTRGTRLRMGKNAELVVTGTAQILRGTRVFIHDGGRLTLGSRTYISDCSTLTCFEEVSIGSGCSISWYTNILDTNVHGLIIDGVPRARSAPVIIEDNVWIGTGVTVLPGVTIRSGAVVGAGSVVTKDVPAKALVAGNPAKVLKADVEWEQ